MTLDPVLEHALRPGSPGKFVRLAGLVSSGVALTGEQIREYSAFWRAEAEQALDDDAPVLVAMGDSLAQAIGASSPERGFVTAAAEQLSSRLGRDVAVLNLSRSGATISDVHVQQLPALVAAGVTPLAVLVMVGSNDLVRAVGPSNAVRDHKALLEDLLESVDAPLVIGTVPSGGSASARMLNRRIRDAAEELDFSLADVARALSSWKGMAAADGFHPNDAGYRAWIESFVGAVAELELDDMS